MTYPDFVEWAKQILDREDVAIALEQAFKQGRVLGYREGFQDGTEKGWVRTWDDEYRKRDA
jgi:flagellar biosynthesis/type III secretory pathway protein FliH